jgi:hypothetical protein
MRLVECSLAPGGVAPANCAPGNYSRSAPPQPGRFRCTKCGSLSHSPAVAK